MNGWRERGGQLVATTAMILGTLQECAGWQEHATAAVRQEISNEIAEEEER